MNGPGLCRYRHEVAGVPFDFVTKAQVLQTIEHWRRDGQRRYIVVNNPNAVMWCHRDPRMMRATLNAGIALPDGVGVILAALLMGLYRRHRVAGPPLMLYLCDHGRALGYRHYFYGGAAGIVQRLAEQLTNMFPGLEIAGMCSPPFTKLTPREDARMVRQINAAGPDILWVGLGCPKQEKWMLDHHRRIAATAMIGVGAAFDFHSGAARWAPMWVRKAGLEWLYRLSCDPRRMWERNLRGLEFGAMVLTQSLQHHLLRAAAHQLNLLRQQPPHRSLELRLWIDRINRFSLPAATRLRRPASLLSRADGERIAVGMTTGVSPPALIASG